MYQFIFELRMEEETISLSSKQKKRKKLDRETQRKVEQLLFPVLENALHYDKCRASLTKSTGWRFVRNAQAVRKENYVRQGRMQRDFAGLTKSSWGSVGALRASPPPPPQDPLLTSTGLEKVFVEHPRPLP